MTDAIAWDELVAHNTYQFEDAYRLQAYRVRILQIIYQQHGDYIKIQFEVIKPKHGCGRDQVFWYGKHLKVGQYLSAKILFKPFGSRFEYAVPGDVR
jgi:hypothetical protein